MAEFCECGSLKIDGRCSNKSCSLRGAAVQTGKTPGAKARRKATPSGETASKAAVPKKSDSRRASRVITYNLYDTKDTKPEE